MERKLVLRAVFIVVVCLTRSLASGADGKASLHSNKTLTHSSSTKEKLTVFRNEYVEVNTTVSLKCFDTKIAWDDMIFVIWKIHLQDKNCIIAVAKNDSDHDNCQDGKRQNHTADGRYHLIIPNFSVKDEGNYTCDASYQSAGSVETIIVSAWARLHLSGWLEYDQGHTVAVCEATGKPAASIHWETPWNSSSSITQSSNNAKQLSTVISRLYLPLNASYRNLSCVATSRDLKHTVTRFSNFTYRDTHFRWTSIVFGVCCTVSIVSILTGLCFICPNYMELSVFRKTCCKPDVPASNEEKPQEQYDPEEVQPYASYVQRVNSIYNSYVDLFNA